MKTGTHYRGKKSFDPWKFSFSVKIQADKVSFFLSVSSTNQKAHMMNSSYHSVATH